MTFSVDVGYRGCCGFKEIYNFTTGSHNSYSGDDWEGVLELLRSEFSSDQLFHLWFVKECIDYDGDEEIMSYEEQYQFEAFRELVKSIPGVKHLGEYVNPNSDNMIDGYMFTNKESANATA